MMFNSKSEKLKSIWGKGEFVDDYNKRARYKEKTDTVGKVAKQNLQWRFRC